MTFRPPVSHKLLEISKTNMDVLRRLRPHFYFQFDERKKLLTWLFHFNAKLTLWGRNQRRNPHTAHRLNHPIARESRLKSLVTSQLIRKWYELWRHRSIQHRFFSDRLIVSVSGLWDSSLFSKFFLMTGFLTVFKISYSFPLQQKYRNHSRLQYTSSTVTNSKIIQFQEEKIPPQITIMRAFLLRLDEEYSYGPAPHPFYELLWTNGLYNS